MNSRSSEQWRIISKHIDFKGKVILDLGCGHCDILIQCIQAGAKCYGVDHNPPDEFKGVVNVRTIEDWMQFDNDYYDVIICFSVLPYLEYPFSVIQWIKDHSEIALIECQYSGDGPGFPSIKDDKDMRDYLNLADFDSVEPIGKTLVEDRNKFRTIWLCR